MRKLYYINKILQYLGVELVKYNARNNQDLRKKQFFSQYHFDLVIDIGANIGGFRDELRQLGYNGIIHSVEPILSVYDILCTKSKEDALWKVHHCAVGDYDGEIEINISSNIHSSSVLDILDIHTNAEPASRYVKKEKAPIYKLDTLANQFSSFNQAFLKIDTQGFEYNVLLGASDVLKQSKAVQLELSLVPLYKNQKIAKDIIAFMDEHGFSLYAIEPGFANEKNGQQYQFDGVFVNRKMIEA